MISVMLLAAMLQGAPAADEQQFRQNFRDGSVKQCVASTKGAPPKLDVAAVCGCVTDRQMEGKTVEQLQQQPDADTVKPIIAQCLREHAPQ
ncbi:MAG: hypothetical protein J0I25_15515 [Sphingomonadales bacterium]|nr:hypothetical protein [Sphingomonadales bacterium]